MQLNDVAVDRPSVILQLEGDLQRALQTGSLSTTEQDLRELTGSASVTFAFKSPTLLQVNLGSVTSALTTPRQSASPPKPKSTKKSLRERKLNPIQWKSREHLHSSSLANLMSDSITEMFKSDSQTALAEWKQQIDAVQQSMRGTTLMIGGMSVVGLWKPLFLNISVEKSTFLPSYFFGAALQGMFVCMCVLMWVCLCCRKARCGVKHAFCFDLPLGALRLSSTCACWSHISCVSLWVWVCAHMRVLEYTCMYAYV